ncbi:hypothetical protein [Roseofilum capinflatum]|uniref:DUF4384 domain-containing protein n=1 Tax=Roseofilum capinflatum BLCC-M114 TaxID=3022440 RepID=A0ABT7B8X3_9CYAN|nr:hypothetical protein [Roseofilum capinflatum]MDJ1175616.1 hypothetical protein [Roseofilum capinflatum BLCC-M114]
MVNSQPQTLQEQFLLHTKQQLFTHNRNSEAQKLCFWHRWHPDNVNKQHTTIKSKIDNDLNGSFAQSNINVTLQQVVEKIKNTFGEQMKLDGVDLEKLQPKKAGAPDVSPWQICYHWLWDKAFPRWMFEKLQKHEKVVLNNGWLECMPLNAENIRRPRGAPQEPPTELIADWGYQLQLQVPFPRYLLLLNQSTDGTYSLCPSLGVCKEYEVSQAVETMPKNAKWPGIYFDPGEEEFLAIVLRDGWPFSDFPEDEIPELTGAQMVEVWETLQRVEWQGFYRRYTVVKP